MEHNAAHFEQVVGRYMLFGQIGAGGMASVHIGRRIGSVGFTRLVAIKRLHPHLGAEKEFVQSFLDEARIAARINHPNVVSIHDVVRDGDEVLLVMDYVHGRSLARLTVTDNDLRRVPARIAATITVDMLHGLQAAHDARDERGRPLDIVHRDVSPQNLLVGVDGIARVLDFGIAKALGRLHTTADGGVKGKLAYTAPERLIGGATTPRVDIFGAGIVFWEMLTGQRFFGGASDPSMIPKVLAAEYRRLEDPTLSELDRVLEQALRRDPAERYATCSEFAVAIENAIDLASRSEVIEWIQSVAGEELAATGDVIAEVERSSVPPSAKILLKNPDAAEATLPGDAMPAVDRATNTQSAVVTLREAPPPTRRMPVTVAVALVAVAAAFAIGLFALRFRASVPTTAAEVPSTPANAAPPPVASTIVPESTTAASTSAPSAAPAERPVTAVRPVTKGNHRALLPRASASATGSPPPTPPKPAPDSDTPADRK